MSKKYFVVSKRGKPVLKVYIELIKDGSFKTVIYNENGGKSKDFIPGQRLAQSVANILSHESSKVTKNSSAYKAWLASLVEVTPEKEVVDIKVISGLKSWIELTTSIMKEWLHLEPTQLPTSCTALGFGYEVDHFTGTLVSSSDLKNIVSLPSVHALQLMLPDSLIDLSSEDATRTVGEGLNAEALEVWKGLPKSQPILNEEIQQLRDVILIDIHSLQFILQEVLGVYLTVDDLVTIKTEEDISEDVSEEDGIHRVIPIYILASMETYFELDSLTEQESFNESSVPSLILVSEDDIKNFVPNLQGILRQYVQTAMAKSLVYKVSLYHNTEGLDKDVQHTVSVKDALGTASVSLADDGEDKVQSSSDVEEHKVETVVEVEKDADLLEMEALEKETRPDDLDTTSDKDNTEGK